MPGRLTTGFAAGAAFVAIAASAGLAEPGGASAPVAVVAAHEHVEAPAVVTPPRPARVPAGPLARAASRRSAESGPTCPPPHAQEAPRCAAGDDAIEIEWHVSSPSP